jgi:hypothetical protein
LISQQPDLILQFGDTLLLLGKSRFDECLDGRRHLGFDLRRDVKSAWGFVELSCTPWGRNSRIKSAPVSNTDPRTVSN